MFFLRRCCYIEAFCRYYTWPHHTPTTILFKWSHFICISFSILCILMRVPGEISQINVTQFGSYISCHGNYLTTIILNQGAPGFLVELIGKLLHGKALSSFLCMYCYIYSLNHDSRILPHTSVNWEFLNWNFLLKSVTKFISTIISPRSGNFLILYS